MPRTALVPAVVALLAIGPGPAPRAAMPQELNLEPGHSLLRRVSEAYKALPGYADRGAVTLSLSKAGEVETETIPQPFAFARSR